MFGPKDLADPLRILWGGTIGLVTFPIWLPALAYERVVAETAEVKLADRGDPMIYQPGEEAPSPVASPDPSSLSNFDFGSYHAVVIGNDRYQHLPALRSAVSDARAISDLLRREYGFSVRVILNATRRDIVTALHRTRQELDVTANLLLYYAGHGYLDPDSNEGYWLPIDARPTEPTNWLANATVTTMLRGLEAKHVIVVSDSCYSGSLNRGVDIQNHPPSYIMKLANKRARVVLTSGGLEPVQDEGGGEHSIFAKYFLLSLRENKSAVIEGSALFLRIRLPVMENALQTPEYGPIRLAGHGGGDFLFVRQSPIPGD